MSAFLLHLVTTHKLAIIDLAHLREWQRVEELHLPRARPLDQALAAVGDERLLEGGARLRRIARHHARLHPLDLRGVGNADHASLGDGGMLAQYCLHLRWIDVEARGLDHALQAHGEIEEPVRVHPPEVAGVQPRPVSYTHLT